MTHRETEPASTQAQPDTEPEEQDPFTSCGRIQHPAEDPNGPLLISAVFDVNSVTRQAAIIQNQWDNRHPENPLHTEALIHHELATINRALPEGLSVESPDATHITGDRTHLPTGWHDRAWQEYNFPEESLAPDWSWEKYMSTFTQEHVNAWQAEGNEGYPPHPLTPPANEENLSR